MTSRHFLFPWKPPGVKFYWTLLGTNNSPLAFLSCKFAWCKFMSLVEQWIRLIGKDSGAIGSARGIHSCMLFLSIWWSCCFLYLCQPLAGLGPLSSAFLPYLGSLHILTLPACCVHRAVPMTYKLCCPKYSWHWEESMWLAASVNHGWCLSSNPNYKAGDIRGIRKHVSLYCPRILLFLGKESCVEALSTVCHLTHVHYNNFFHKFSWNWITISSSFQY